MNKFNQAFNLREKIGLIIPSTIDVVTTFDNQAYINDALEKLSTMFGGATAVNQQGGWVSDQHGLVIENNTMVYAYATDLGNKALDKVYEYAEKLAADLKQEAIAVEINGAMYFVEAAAEVTA